MKREVTLKCEKRRDKREEGRQKIEEHVEASKLATAAPAKKKEHPNVRSTNLGSN